MCVGFDFFLVIVKSVMNSFSFFDDPFCDDFDLFDETHFQPEEPHIDVSVPVLFSFCYHNYNGDTVINIGLNVYAKNGKFFYEFDNGFLDITNLPSSPDMLIELKCRLKFSDVNLRTKYIGCIPCRIVYDFLRETIYFSFKKLQHKLKHVALIKTKPKPSAIRKRSLTIRKDTEEILTNALNAIKYN